jgi:hypothetical protein
MIKNIDLVTGVPTHIDNLNIGERLEKTTQFKLSSNNTVENKLRDDRIRLSYFNSINLTMIPIMYFI